MNGVGGGLIEVIISPIVDSCPGDAKASAMSLLHSFYCWGQVGVVLITTLLLRLIGGNIKIAPLNIALQFLDQRIGKKIFCIDVFHAGFLLEMIVKQQSQHIDYATIFTPCKRRNLLALHGAILR